MTKITRFVDPKDPENKDKFKYLYPDGTQVKDRKILEWISSLRIPPAWTGVTINYSMSTKQTAVGVDAKGRMQALYSEQHIKKARHQKYCDLIEFGEKLPRIQSDIVRALDAARFSKSKIIALILKIVACCSFRLGTLTYEAQNESYGITTIRKQHVTFESGKAIIKFIGKKGVLNECVVEDDQCVKALLELHKIKKPDDHIMMYQHAGSFEHIKHTDVNNWLKSYGENFTSKDFRTFASNILIIERLRVGDHPGGLLPTKRKKKMNDAIKEVAAIVHNTPAVCRKDYIDPRILELYMEHPVNYRSRFITPGTDARIMFLHWLRAHCPKSG